MICSVGGGTSPSPPTVKLRCGIGTPKRGRPFFRQTGQIGTHAQFSDQARENRQGTTSRITENGAGKAWSRSAIPALPNPVQDPCCFLISKQSALFWGTFYAHSFRIKNGEMGRKPFSRKKRDKTGNSCEAHIGRRTASQSTGSSPLAARHDFTTEKPVFQE